jgi:V-type H+-transporting ATPase subunit D
MLHFLLNAEITRRIDEAKRKMGRVMQIAAFSLAEVTYAVGGDIGYQIQEAAKNARFRLNTRQENVSGVFLPQFESTIAEGNNDFGLTGLGKGGQQVQRCRETYARAVETLVELASLQVSSHRRLRLLHSSSNNGSCAESRTADSIRHLGRGHQGGE